MSAITVIKLDHAGVEKRRYSGCVLARGETWVQLEAPFTLPEVDVAGMVLRQGDRFVEWFYADRWYNIFEIHERDDDQLKGWYCNVCRPARLGDDEISAEDLALDLLVWPDGRQVVLDEDEFAALPLAETDRAAALTALYALRRMVARREPPFDAPGSA